MWHQLDPSRTTWLITVGTYGTRLHGDERPTVARHQNKRGQPFLLADAQLRESERLLLKSKPVLLTREQCLYVQDLLPEICQRGGWTCRTCSAAENHFHLLLDIAPEVHGEKARRLIKRWLTQALSERWPREAGAPWWADEGSNKPVKDENYLNRAFPYVFEQRTV